MNIPKRVMAVHDISCMGRCSLTVALPVLSAAGAETCVIPTAVLSTHTGGFEGYTFRDLTEDVPEIARHWATLNRRFDAIYTGYLGSLRQIELVSQIIDDFAAPGQIVLVDPVMGDAGRLYAHFTPDFVKEMRKLCKKAHLAVPNLTEAAFLLDEPFPPPPHSDETIRRLLQKMCELGPKKTVLTGVQPTESEIGAACFDAETGEYSVIVRPKVEGFYHGTGDVFAAVLLAGLLRDPSLPDAVSAAADFTRRCIAATKAAGTDVRFGVLFEPELPGLMRTLGLV